MPIGSIISQPEANALKAAYRPIVIVAGATATDNSPRPPVVYCDIYFNAVYYKTISKTQYKTLNLSNTEWQIDIQDAAQEYLRKFLGNNGESAIVEAAPIITAAFCRFRSSGNDVNGFIVAEGTTPVQATEDVDPVPGDGFESNTFFILNATLQHEDSQDLSVHLNNFKRRTWANNTKPLSHRPDNYTLCIDDSDIFPIVHEGNDISCLVLRYRNRGQSTFSSVTNCQILACPVPSGVQIFVQEALDGTQSFTFDWDDIADPTAQIDIQYRAANSNDSWISNIGSITPTRQIDLPAGVYDFRFVGIGDCASTPSEVYEDYGTDECRAVTLRSIASSMPDAQAGVAYNFIVPMLGTLPFVLNVETKPSWMTATIIGYNLVFGGTPTSGDTGAGIDVKYTVSNCSGNESATIATTIDVSSTLLSTITNNSFITYAYKVKVNGLVYGAGTIGPNQTKTFAVPDVPLGAGYDLTVYTGLLLMSTCVATSNSVNIPMVIDASGPGTNNLALNLTNFSIVNGVQIVVS